MRENLTLLISDLPLVFAGCDWNPVPALSYMVLYVIRLRCCLPMLTSKKTITIFVLVVSKTRYNIEYSSIGVLRGDGRATGSGKGFFYSRLESHLPPNNSK